VSLQYGETEEALTHFMVNMVIISFARMRQVPLARFHHKFGTLFSAGGSADTSSENGNGRTFVSWFGCQRRDVRGNEGTFSLGGWPDLVSLQ
jgi:hypothetical protein